MVTNDVAARGIHDRLTNSVRCSLRHRLPVRFSIRALLVFVAAISAYVGFEVNRARRHSEAIRAVERLHGRVFDQVPVFLEVLGPRPAFTTAQPPFPMWLSQALGADGRCAASIFLPDREFRPGRPLIPITDHDVECLSELTEMQELILDGNQITNVGIRHLEGLAALRSLELGVPKLTDAGLASIARLGQLELLRINAFSGSGDGIKHFLNLQRLRLLEITSDSMDDSAMRQIARLEHLAGLAISSPNVTDAGLWELRNARSLRLASITSDRITDDGLAKLRYARPDLKVNENLFEKYQRLFD